MLASVTEEGRGVRSPATRFARSCMVAWGRPGLVRGVIRRGGRLFPPGADRPQSRPAWCDDARCTKQRQGAEVWSRGERSDAALEAGLVQSLAGRPARARVRGSVQLDGESRAGHHGRRSSVCVLHRSRGFGG